MDLIEPKDLRSADYNQAALQLIQETCFLSPARHQHTLCQRYYDTISEGRPPEEMPDLWLKFYCLGAAVQCTNCDARAMVPPGGSQCPRCRSRIHNPPSTQEEWIRRVIARTITNNVMILRQQTSYASHIVLHGAWLAYEYRLLEWGEDDTPSQKTTTLLNFLFEAIEQDEQYPIRADWIHNWARYVARFVVEVWPLLKERGFTFKEIEGLTTYQIMSLAIEVREQGEQIITAFLENPNIFRRPRIGKARMREYELLREARIMRTEEGPFLLVPISPDDLEVLQIKYGWKEIPNGLPAVHHLLEGGLPD